MKYNPLILDSGKLSEQYQLIDYYEIISFRMRAKLQIARAFYFMKTNFLAFVWQINSGEI